MRIYRIYRMHANLSESATMLNLGLKDFEPFKKDNTQPPPSNDGLKKRGTRDVEKTSKFVRSLFEICSKFVRKIVKIKPRRCAFF